MRNPFRREDRSQLDNANIPVFQALLAMTEGIDGATGVHVSPQRAMRVVAFLACVKLIAETIASLEMQLFENGDKTGTRKPSTDPRGRLLALEPNPDMTAYDFWSYVIMCMCVYGNAYVWIETDGGGDVVALWPIRPDVRKHKADDGSVRWVVTFEDGSEGWLFDAEVMHFKGLGLESGSGLSNVGQARQAIGIAMAAEEYAGRMFQGDGHAGAVLSTERPMNDEQFNQFRARWDASHSGLKNAHRFALLPAGMTYQSSGFDPTNLQMVEARKFQVREMARLFRIPPHMIADMEGGASYSSVEQASIDFVTYTLRPWLVNISQVVTRKLLSFGQADASRGLFVEHDTSVLLRADSVSRSKIDNVDRLAGIKTANEIRESRGLPPIDGGDVLWQPVNVQVVGADGSIITPGVDVGADVAGAQGDTGGGDLNA